MDVNTTHESEKRSYHFQLTLLHPFSFSLFTSGWNGSITLYAHILSDFPDLVS